MSMRDRIDPLILERARWLGRRDPFARGARTLLDRLLGYERTLALAEEMQGWPAGRIMARMGALVARRVSVRGLGHVPARGPVLFVSNHPTGIADGIVLYSLLGRVRPDLYVLANADMLRVMPQLSQMVLPVEWRLDKRTRAKTRETMELMRTAVAAGRAGLIFPSGRLAKRRGLRLHERPWMPSAASLARKFDLPVIPVHVLARNSALFYAFDAIHPSLRDITLFHETLNKGRQPFRVHVGEPISAAALPARAEDGIELLREATLALGGPDAPSLSLMRAARSLG